MLQHTLQNKSLQPSFIVVYNFETMIVDTDDQSKLEELRKNKDESFTVKTGKHAPIKLALTVHYLEGIGQNKYFSYIGEDCLDV